MYLNLGLADSYVRLHVEELLREVEADRLAELAKGPRLPLRARLASWLIAVAELIDPATGPSIEAAASGGERELLGTA